MESQKNKNKNMILLWVLVKYANIDHKHSSQPQTTRTAHNTIHSHLICILFKKYTLGVKLHDTKAYPW